MEISVNLSLTELEKKKILANFQVISDTREKENTHITEYLKSKNREVIFQKLDFGDYSINLPSTLIGIDKNVNFSNQIVIERKNSLEELSSNFADGRKRFEEELAWAYDKNVHILLMLEKGCFEDLYNGNYNTSFNTNAYRASLLTFMNRYNFKIIFVEKQLAGKFIEDYLYYWLKEKL